VIVTREHHTVQAGVEAGLSYMKFVPTSRLVIFILVIRAGWAALYEQPGVAAQHRKCSTATFCIVGSPNKNKSYASVTQTFCGV